MAFGSILEGPDPSQLKPLVEQAMPMLIELMKDNSVVVKVKYSFLVTKPPLSNRGFRLHALIGHF